ncbi:hypothetical protein [Sulfuricystis multivorans]|uniref:hypothetical protein n=1 Tax=Sulfuricystis multivorans TaxID=2211108 RepID=UPI000F832C46|nr:hypothetical protein [Sulfuricystis multivorans]
MLVWLGVCAIVAFLAALAAALGAVPPAPTFHLAFALGSLPLIFGAIAHFVPVLTKSRAAEPSIHYLPLPVQVAGLITPLALAGILPQWFLHLAATIDAAAAVLLLFWVSRRLRAALGAPHPGAYWYGAALLCLFFALSLVPVWLMIPTLRPPLRLFHLHLNTLGFIGLAALGTLPVLLPTALRQFDATAAARLREDLLPALTGAVSIAAGATVGFWFAVPGAMLLAWVVGRDLFAWWRVYGAKVGATATAPLFIASVGFLILLIAGLAHGAGGLAARPALSGYVAFFLLPLVSGALAQLIPVWRFPGVDSPARQVMQRRLAGGGRFRAMLFLGAGLALLFEAHWAWLLAALALADFVLRLLGALYNPRQP